MTIDVIRHHALKFNLLICDYMDTVGDTDKDLERENILLEMAGELTQLHLSVEDTAGENYRASETLDGQHKHGPFD